MRSLSSQEVIVAMLESYMDVCGPAERGAGADANDSRTLMIHPLWRKGTFAELHRCLYEMRSRRPNPDEHGRSLYWHVSHRYLRVEKRITEGCPECRQPTKLGVRHDHPNALGRSVKVNRGPIVQVTFHPGVDEGRVAAGVSWIVREHRGPPFLPLELYSLEAA